MFQETTRRRPCSGPAGANNGLKAPLNLGGVETIIRVHLEVEAVGKGLSVETLDVDRSWVPKQLEVSRHFGLKASNRDVVGEHELRLREEVTLLSRE